MWLTNAMVLNEDFQLVRTDLRIENDIIAELGTAPADAKDVTDLSGQILMPGLIDMHTHACDGADSSDGSLEEMNTISRYEASQGVTSFLATTMTLTDDLLLKAMTAIRDFAASDAPGAYVHGINMEGPYLSHKKRGAHKDEWIRRADLDHFRMLNAASGNLVKVVSVAPEMEGAMEFIREAKDLTRVAIAHTATDYDGAMAAFAAGCTHATHTFNAMSGFLHRDPGVVGAIFDSEVTGEMICDCVHIHPAVLRTAFKVMGKRLIMISDSMAATGLSDGEYELGGLKVFVKNGAATLEDGTIAGSTTPLSGDLQKLVKIVGIPFETAAYACTMGPAKVIGVDDLVGSIAVGKRADLISLDGDYAVSHVWIKGRAFK